MNLTRAAAEAAAFARAASSQAFANPTGRQHVAMKCGLSEARWQQLELVLTVLARYGLVRLTADHVATVAESQPRFIQLADQMAAIAEYLEATREAEALARVVITYPPSPSEFASALRASGFGSHGIEATENALDELAKVAETRIVCVSPFLDNEGMELWLRILRRKRASCRAILLTRRTSTNDFTEVAGRFADSLAQYNCEIRQFRPQEIDIPRETFHAKVILCDARAAYIGSANLTGTSISYSLEIGTLVQGQSARTVATVVDAMLTCSKLVE
jgi:phosphatidylserine/phosphatidylglycerophosphate/cardiolipin synthase-like enzyme